MGLLEFYRGWHGAAVSLWQNRRALAGQDVPYFVSHAALGELIDTLLAYTMESWFLSSYRCLANTSR